MRALTLLATISLAHSAWGQTARHEAVASALRSAGPTRVAAMGLASLNRLAAPTPGAENVVRIAPESLDLLVEHLPAGFEERSFSGLPTPARLEALAEAAARAETFLGKKIDEAVQRKMTRREELGTPTAYDQETLAFVARHRLYLSPDHEYKVGFLSRDHLARLFDNEAPRPQPDQEDVSFKRSGPWPERDADAEEDRSYAVQARRRMASDARLRLLHERIKVEDAWAADWLTAKVGGLAVVENEQTYWLDRFRALALALRNPNFKRAVTLTQGPIAFRTRWIMTGAYHHPRQAFSWREKAGLALAAVIGAAGLAVLFIHGLPLPAAVGTSLLLTSVGFFGVAGYLRTAGLFDAERRLLGRKGGIVVSPVFSSDVIVHELAHRFDYQLLSWFPNFRSRVERLYAEAVRHGRTTNPYAATSAREYFAVGLQAYFTHHGPTFMGTRWELKRKDPGLHDLLDEIFGPYAKPIPGRPSPDYLAEGPRVP